MAEPTTERSPDDQPVLRNPFRNERDTFRLLVMILVAAAICIGLALIEPAAGIVAALIALALGAWQSAGWLRVWLGTSDDEQQ